MMVTPAVPHAGHVKPSVIHVLDQKVFNLNPDYFSYTLSKLALERAVSLQAQSLAPTLRVNAVAPGTADTPWVARILEAAPAPDEAAAALKARQPLGRLVTAPEVAHAICSLASPAASSTTGTILRVDGGMTTLRVPPR